MFMKIRVFLAFVAQLVWYGFVQKVEIKAQQVGVTPPMSFYQFSLPSLTTGELVDFSAFKGKKIVLLNVASQCGYTPQYADWEAFHRQHGDHIVVLGFPANNFKGQEPGSNAEIAEFCSKNYGVTFQMFEKLEVIGPDQHPLYQWLSHKEMNGWNDQAPTWNFCKYVVNEEGELTHFFPRGIKPNDPDFRKAVGL